MFSKTAKTPAKPPVKFDSTPAPLAADPSAQRKAPRAASLISENITIEGNVTGEGEVHIDGVVRGDVRVGKLTVGETGHIEGGVYAEAIEARGRIIGAVTAKQVRLYGTAYVDGDITHEQLAMETGAFFQGRSLKFQRQATPPTPAPSPLAQASAPAPTPGLAPKPV
ncbi:polymer-forming cytoskeletal protein [Phenylobacterium sp.]|uniref:bactofilin family protein n=1 Tax=Phenylobacterium sp. TaxID=1871053 RepID=UPI00286DEF8F|nr:polymer-forming cytoskeletal protein [Phenylobacterium sp.]